MLIKHKRVKGLLKAAGCKEKQLAAKQRISYVAYWRRNSLQLWRYEQAQALVINLSELIGYCIDITEIFEVSNGKD